MNAYARPQTLEEAAVILRGGPRTVLAGGTDLYPQAGQTLGGAVLDLTAIPDLMGFDDSDGLRIGACTTWTQIAEANLPPSCHALQHAARQVGGRQIQNVGTIGGNLCNASPAADGVPPFWFWMQTLNCWAHLAGAACPWANSCKGLGKLRAGKMRS